MYPSRKKQPKTPGKKNKTSKQKTNQKGKYNNDAWITHLFVCLFSLECDGVGGSCRDVSEYIQEAIRNSNSEQDKKREDNVVAVTNACPIADWTVFLNIE